MPDNLWGFLNPSAVYDIETVIALLLATTSFVVLVWSIRRTSAPYRFALLATALVVIVWTGSHLLAISLADPQQKLWLFYLRLFSAFLLPPIATLCVLLLTQQSGRVRAWVLIAQALVLVVMTGLLLTNHQHNLIFSSIPTQVGNGIDMLTTLRGPLMTVHWAYAFLVLIADMLLVLHEIGAPHFVNIHRSLPLLLGIIAPLLTYAYALSNDAPIKASSLLALTIFLLFCFTATWIALSVRDFSPVAKNMVFDRMTQGALVLDNKMRIAELNRVVETLVKQSAERLRDRNVYELRDNWPQLVQFCLNLPTAYDDRVADKQEMSNEVFVSEVGYWGGLQQRFFEVRSSRLLDRRHLPIGWAIVLTDITEQKRNTRTLADEKNRLQLLYTLSQELYGLLTSSEAASKAVDLTVSALGYYMGELSILDPTRETLRVLAVSNQSEETVAAINEKLSLRVGRGLAGTAAAERKLTIWTQLGRDQKWYEAVGIDVSVRSGVAIPLLAGEQLLGVLTLLSDDQDGIRESDRPLFTAIALPVALALHNAYRFEEAQRRSAFFEELANLSNALRRAHNRGQVIDTFLQHILSYFGAENADIAEPTEDGKFLYPSNYRGVPRETPIKAVPIEHSILGKVFQTGECHYSPNIFEDPLSSSSNFSALKQSLGRSPLITAIHAPLHAEGKIIGVILLQSSVPNTFQPEDLQILSAFAEIGGNAIGRAQILETLEQRIDERTWELEKANRQLSELDQLKNEFIASVNHELRTPLTNIKLYLSLLAEGKEERRTKYLEVIQRETAHLARLLDDSLDLSQLDKARVSGSHQHITFDARTLIRSMTDKYEAKIRSKGLEFQIKAPNRAVMLDGNQEQIEQAISNLLENAVEFTDHGFVGLEIVGKEDHVFICVSDSGHGIPEYEIPRIWNRFYRGKRVRGMAHAGYGLGLSIVKEIIDLHNGQILVESKEASGSRFEITLPIVSQKVLNGSGAQLHPEADKMTG